MKKKNLIIFSYDFPPSDGGIARLCHEISMHANSYYENVKILTKHKEGANNPYNQDSNIEIIRTRKERGKCELDSLKYLRSIKNKGQYDILCGLWHPEATIALLSGFKNVYILAHGTEFLHGSSLFRRYFWLPIYSHRLLQKSKGIIANSDYTLNLVRSINKKAKAIALPLAVNHNFFKPLQQKDQRKETISICSVSRIYKYKGHDFILKTISSLPTKELQMIRYNIAGRGDYLPTLKQLVKNLNLEEVVTFHGFVDDKDLPDFYNNNDLFILCTRETSNSADVEGFGLVFLEAQSCGLPVIGTRSGGIPDAVENNNGGWLIEQDNQTELLNLLNNLINNPLQLYEMGSKARTRVEKEYTWEYYCEKLFKYLSV